MYKIQVRSVKTNGDWSDMVNMPPFYTWDDANKWLVEKNTHVISDVFEFQIVKAE